MKEQPDLTDPERVEIPTDAAELAHRIVEIASDKKGNDIVLLRTAELTTMADFFVIMSGRSDRQVQALAGAIVDELRDDGIRPLGTEGRAVGPLGAARLRRGHRPRLRPRGARLLRPRAPLERRHPGRPRRLTSPDAQGGVGCTTLNPSRSAASARRSSNVTNGSVAG